VNDLAHWIGSLVIGAGAVAIWIVGAIAGADYIKKNISVNAGEWFGIIWFVSLPILLGAYVMSQ